MTGTDPTLADAGELAMRDRLRSALFATPPTSRTFGRYVVTGMLGRGGLGVVYSAHDPELARDVAIKLVAGASGRPRKVRARLRREAQALARLHHPNVVTVHDVGMHDGEVFLAMELVDGRTLSSWAQERSRSWREIRDILVGAARGLAAAHHVDLVHRDVKPANILVDRREQARVLDFGLARAVADRDDAGAEAPPSMHSDLTDGDVLLGTPAYMAPEQLAGVTVDARTDQWGLCVTAYELLYGRRPFAAADLAALREQRRAGAVPLPAKRGDVPLWLHRVIARGLAHDPEDRWPDMDALVRELLRDRSAPRRRAGIIVAALGLASVSAGVAWMGRAATWGAIAECSARVRVSGFHAQWSTPNQIRWGWTVEEGDVDTLQEYRVELGQETRIYGPADNPELAFLQLPSTRGRDLVDGTVTDGLAPETEYSARLIAIDNLGCESVSNVATERTPPLPIHTLRLFSDDPIGHTFPLALVPARDPERAFAGAGYLEYRSAEDPECEGAEGACYQNLRLFDLDAHARIGEAYGKSAYLEFAIFADTPATAYWANVMVLYGTQWSSFDQWTVRSQPEYRIVQVPLRVIRGGDVDPSDAPELRVLGFAIGGGWGYEATIRLDEIRIRY